MILIPLILSTLLLTVILAIGSKNGRQGMAGWCAFLGVFFFGGFLLSPLLMLNALLIGIAAFVCNAVAARARTFQAVVLAATIVAYLVYGGLAIVPELREVARERERDPMESLADRLAYETRYSGRLWESQAPAEILERLVVLESRLGDHETSRAAKLRKLHRSYVLQFIDSDGFGVGRMIGANANRAFGTVGASIGTVGIGGVSPQLRPQGHSEPDWETRPFPPREYEDPSLPYRDPWQSSVAAPEAPILTFPGREVFLQMHHAGVVDFINRDSFGYIQDREHVAGFRPHGMKQFPSLDRADERWQLRRLDLVGLLKHDEPVAYVSERLPRMDELRNAPVRPLDALERKMLGELQRGEELQVMTTGDHIQMLGSIRAARQCLDCHHVKRGDLLGAFSYKLRRQ